MQSKMDYELECATLFFLEVKSSRILVKIEMDDDDLIFRWEDTYICA